MIPDSSRHLLLIRLSKVLGSPPKSSVIRSWCDRKACAAYKWLIDPTKPKPQFLRRYR